ncbi:MAG: FHA domain-containing protein [Fuerstiella sp.]
MSWFLRVQEGDEFVDAAVLAESRPLIIGRADNADLSFPDDSEMSSRHVSVELIGENCHFSDLQSTNGTLLNGEPATEGELQPGARLQCGTTVLCVELGSTSGRQQTGAAENFSDRATWWPTKPHGSSEQAEPEPLPEELQITEGYVADTASEIVERFLLQKLLTMLPEESETTDDFVARLLSANEENDSLNFLAFALPKRLGVWWLVQCIRSEDGAASEEDIRLLEIVAAWVREPGDQGRRQAMGVAEELEMGTPAAWAGVASFWSHGSMAPAGQPDVPAKDEMAGKAIAGGVILASVVDPPERALKRRLAFGALAQEIVRGEIGWA